MPMTPPARTFPAKPAAPAPASFVRTGTVCGWNPGFVKVTSNSSERGTSSEQGVVAQYLFVVVATAAPGGSEVKAISSVVPRVTLPHAARLTATSAAARDCLNMMYCPPTASADGGAIV